MHSHGREAGFEAWVESRQGKKRLVTQKPGTETDPPYAQCFLETIDEAFAITVNKSEARHPHSDWQLQIYVDGRRLENFAWLKPSKTLMCDSIHTERDGRTYQSELLFTPLATTDDPTSVTLDAEKGKELGSIVITLERGTMVPSGFHRIPVTNIEPLIGDEKAKKMAYTVKSRELQAVPDVVTPTCHFIPCRNGGIFYKFVFNYRPRAVLVRMGLIDEPEPEIEPAPASALVVIAPRRKRKILHVVDLSDEESEDGEQDARRRIEVKKEKKQKRIEYLEEQLLKANERLRRQSGASTPIDLTVDDE
ncbi:hypothetical protein IAR55_002427 [Kwoniella newhampshirensis]|uniref:DUF7918 domain-containing protein n=1 Tax=Kwoniella newhampshirensis TaxID=1651941 RepID=A0AAW0Z134_9TREE